MQVTVGALNVARGLSDPARREALEEGIEALETDIFFISEAFDYKTYDPQVPRQVAQRLGCAALCVAYEDAEEHPSTEQYLMTLAGCSLPAGLDARPKAVRLGTRNAIEMNLRMRDDFSTRKLLFSHFDDRSEEHRKPMAEAAAKYEPLFNPVALMGDLNATHGDDFFPSLLRSFPVRTLARLAPIKRVQSLGSRLVEMAKGETMQILEKAGFSEVDDLHQPTKSFVQLDHLLIGRDERLTYVPDTYGVHDIDGTDHRAITATLQLNMQTYA